LTSGVGIVEAGGSSKKMAAATMSRPFIAKPDEASLRTYLFCDCVAFRHLVNVGLARLVVESFSASASRSRSGVQYAARDYLHSLRLAAREMRSATETGLFCGQPAQSATAPSIIDNIDMPLKKMRISTSVHMRKTS
jgi:hypothetical protein